MKTAQDVIMEIQELPPEEKQIVVDFVASIQEEEFFEENYSPEDIAKILQAGELAEKGIGVSPELEGEEAVHYLKKLRNT